MSTIQIPQNKNVLLFDMDGTLVDTEPVGPQNFIHQLQKYGVVPSSEEIDFFTKVWRRDGTDVKEDEYLAEIVTKYDIQRTPEDYLDEFFSMYEVAIIEAAPLAGVDSFLKKAKESGKFKMAVVTASKSSQVAAVLRTHQWSNLFDVIIAEENITRHKPDPEPYNVAMSKLEALPEACVVFEDSKNGAIAGSNAHCYVIGLTIGNSKAQDLSAADVVAKSLTDIEV